MAKVINKLFDVPLSNIELQAGDFVLVKGRKTGLQFFARVCQVGFGEYKLINVKDGNRLTDTTFASGLIPLGHSLREDFEFFEVIPSKDVTIILERRAS